jgi:hypothetical protein
MLAVYKAKQLDRIDMRSIFWTYISQSIVEGSYLIKETIEILKKGAS